MDKTFSNRSNARRHARAAGLDLEKLDFYELKDGRWTYGANRDQQLIDQCGHARCPHCGVHLDNGLMDHVNDPSLQHEWSCMGCGEEFGDLVVRGEKRQYNRTGENSFAHTEQIRGARKGEGAVAFLHRLYDELAAKHGAPVERGAGKMFVAEGVARGVNLNTCRTQLSRWKNLRGVRGL